MKKTIFTLLTIGALTPVFGQGVYLGVNAGYGFSVALRELDYNSTANSDGMSYSWTDELVCGSFGSGINFGGQVGFMFNEQIGVEVNANYLLGSKIKATSDYTGSGGYSSESTSTQQGKMLNVAPMFVMNVVREGVSPYAKFGLNIGMMGSITTESDYSNTDGDRESMMMKFDQGIAFGFVGETGVRFGLGEKLSLNLGVRAVGMNWAPLHGLITEYTVNGVDELSQMTTYEKEIEFLNSVSGDSSNPPDANNPDQTLKVFMPFSSVGLNVGVVISL